MKNSISLGILLFSAGQLFAQDFADYKLRLSLSVLDAPHWLAKPGRRTHALFQLRTSRPDRQRLHIQQVLFPASRLIIPYFNTLVPKTNL